MQYKLALLTTFFSLLLISNAVLQGWSQGRDDDHRSRRSDMRIKSGHPRPDGRDSSAACSFPTLTNGKAFPTGLGPWDVAAGDINNDGKLDLVTANFQGNSLSVLTGDRSGNFQPNPDIPLDSRVRFIALKDLNRDGNLDAISLTQAGSVSRVLILLGNGMGAFGMGSQYFPNDPSDVKIVDVNNDGNDDLVVKTGDSVVADVLVYPGNGAGSFGSPVTTRLPEFSHLSIEVGDFNEDGFVDLLTSSQTTGLFFWTGNGSGTFVQSWTFAPANGLIYKGNLNGDALTDFVVMNTTFRYVQAFTGNGHGTFTPLGRHTIGEVAVEAAVGDIDHDGIDDVVTSNFASNEVSVSRI
jgi:hypothetical protein